MISSYSTLDIQYHSIQQLQPDSDKELEKLQQWRADCTAHHQKLQQSQADCAQTRHKSQQLRTACAQTRHQFRQLRANCAQTRHQSQQLRSGLNSLQASNELHSEVDGQKQVIEKLPAPHQNFLRLMQLQSDLDARLALINELQSDVGSRLAGLEQLQSNFNTNLPSLERLMENQTSFVSASDVSSASAHEAQLKTVLENLHGLINKFVTGDWSEADFFAASDPQRGSLAAKKFFTCVPTCDVERMNLSWG